MNINAAEFIDQNLDSILSHLLEGSTDNQVSHILQSTRITRMKAYKCNFFLQLCSPVYCVLNDARRRLPPVCDG